MGSFVLALLFFGGGVASIMGTVILKFVNVVTGRGGVAPWISDDLNLGRYDCYYLLLAVRSWRLGPGLLHRLRLRFQ